MEYLKGIVEIYPALNPLGVNSITRGVPGFDLDMNRVFPGSEESSLPEYAAYKIMEDLKVLLFALISMPAIFSGKVRSVQKWPKNFFHMQKN